MRNIDLKSASGRTRRGESVRPAPKARVFSAKGAAFNQSLGQRPRIQEPPSVSAEGATHGRRYGRADESRFQRSCIWGTSIPGAVPQAKSEIAPLALHTGQKAFGLHRGRVSNPPAAQAAGLCSNTNYD
jgi:hypothetical protein